MAKRLMFNEKRCQCGATTKQCWSCGKWVWAQSLEGFYLFGERLCARCYDACRKAARRNAEIIRRDRLQFERTHNG